MGVRKTMADFEFFYLGDADAGKVTILFQGREFPDLRVVREGNDWKLDEK